LGDRAQTSSPPAIRRIPRPPAAAPAAGGRGNLESRLVYKVGLGRVPSGGVVEVRALPVRCLLSACVPFGGGAPRSFDATQLTSPSLWIHGSREFVKLQPDPCRRRIWTLKMAWKTKPRRLAAELEVLGVDSSESVRRRLPSCHGAGSGIQGLRSSGSGAPPAHPAIQRGRDLDGEEEGPLFNFLFLWISL
jgi:hypothetical protein